MANKEPNPFEDFVTTEAVDGVTVEPKAEEKDPPADGDEVIDGGEKDPPAEGEEAIKEGEPEEDAEGEEDDAPEDDEKPEAEKPPKPKRHFSDRYREFKDKERTWEREKADYEQRLAALEKGEKPPAKETPDPAKAKAERPKSTDEKYKYGELDPEYIADLAGFEARKIISEEREKDRAEAKKTADKEHATAVDTKAKASVEAGEKEFKDFKAVVFSDTSPLKQLSDEFLDLVLDSPVGHKIVYHLASHPDEARGIFSKPVTQQAASFGRLEARFTATAVKQGKPPLKTPAEQPRGAGGKFKPAPEDMDFSTFEAEQNAKQK